MNRTPRVIIYVSDVRLFPMVVMTACVELFCARAEEDGWKSALGSAGGTVVTVAAAYGLMSVPGLLGLLWRHPEVLLWVAAGVLLCGRWTGMRLGEFVRFRPLLNREPAP